MDVGEQQNASANFKIRAAFQFDAAHHHSSLLTPNSSLKSIARPTGTLFKEEGFGTFAAGAKCAPTTDYQTR